MNEDEKLNKLLEIVKGFYIENDLDVCDIMYFYVSGIASIIAQIKEEFDYEKFVEQVKVMVEIVKNESNP